MVKYVDAGYEDPGSSGGKKKSKKGFKADRRANYERMMARKFTGKDVKKPAEKRPTRVKSVVFDDAARKEYLLTLHKKKNERRVQAFVDVKKKLRRESARTRQQQREEARRAYNNYARVPILPNYTFQMPNYVDRLDGSGEESEESEAYERESDAAETSSLVSSQREASGSDRDDQSAWVNMGHDGAESDGVDEEEEEGEECRLRRLLAEKKRLRKLATKSRSSHAMPASMAGGEDRSHVDRTPTVDEESVTVEVKPLFGGRSALTGPGAAGDRGRPASTLPSQNFSDLPSVVEQELRRLRQETKGPSRTKSKVHMMKELEKIRKIKKHSRKGHGKRKASGKRKNRRK